MMIVLRGRLWLWLLLAAVTSTAQAWQPPLSSGNMRMLATRQPAIRQPRAQPALALGAAKKSAAAAGKDVPATFTLDKSVIPRRPYLLEGALVAALAPAALKAADAALTKTLVVAVPVLRAVAGLLAFLVQQVSKLAERQTQRIDLVTATSVAPSSAEAGLGERLMQNLRSVFSFLQPQEFVNLEQWQPCRLVAKEKLGTDFAVFRFELANPRAALPLNPGEELTICARDAHDELVKESFFPVSPRNARGYFEVLVKKNPGATDAAALAAASIGDELAVKAGKDHLSAKAPEERIEAMQIIASAEGIAPAIQTMQAVLQPKDSTVKSVDLIWVNEHPHEFLLANRVEALARRYSRRLKVVTITDSDLYGHDITNHPAMRQALKRFEPSTMALACGPDYVVDRVQRYLTAAQSYPSDHIAAVKF